MIVPVRPVTTSLGGWVNIPVVRTVTFLTSSSRYNHGSTRQALRSRRQAARRLLGGPERQLFDRQRAQGVGAGRVRPDLHGRVRGQSLQDRQAGIRRCPEVAAHLPGQPGQDQQPRPDSPGAGPDDSTRHLNGAPMYRSLWLASICAVALTASACKRDAADTGTAGTTTTTPPAAAPVSGSEIRTGKAIGADNRVADETSEFAPTETIYASVATTGSAPSTTLVARWTFQDGQVVS